MLPQGKGMVRAGQLDVIGEQTIPAFCAFRYIFSWDGMCNKRNKSRITTRDSKAHKHRFDYGLFSFLKLTAGFFKKDTLPDFCFDSLSEKWHYCDPHCVSDSFSRNTLPEKDIDLSICIPAYNVEKTIIRLLKQIDNQRTSFKVEVLIVNDGSTDRTGHIVERFIDEKDNFHLYHQENAGLSAARNKAIDNSSGRYLTFIDSDDEICDGFIENLMSAAILNDADIVRGQYYTRYGSHMHLCDIASAFAWEKFTVPRCLTGFVFRMAIGLRI